jgi:hypothetical protein
MQIGRRLAVVFRPLSEAEAAARLGGELLTAVAPSAGALRSKRRGA